MAKKPTKSSSLPDLSGFSLEDLTHLHHHVGQHLEERRQARIKELQAELESLGGADGGGIRAGARRGGGGDVVGNGIRGVGKGKTAPPASGTSDSGGRTRAKPPVK